MRATNDTKKRTAALVTTTLPDGTVYQGEIIETEAGKFRFWAEVGNPDDWDGFEHDTLDALEADLTLDAFACCVDVTITATPEEAKQ